MAQITIESTGGAGIHAVYHVKTDGKLVASITRFGAKDPWVIKSIPYGLALGHGNPIDRARERALGIEYPSPAEQFEMRCREIEGKRRGALEMYYRNHFIRLGRAIVAGSNSAHADLAELIEKIDRIATDRGDTDKRRQQEFIAAGSPSATLMPGDDKQKHDDYWYAAHMQVPVYPEPPRGGQ